MRWGFAPRIRTSVAESDEITAQPRPTRRQVLGWGGVFTRAFVRLPFFLIVMSPASLIFGTSFLPHGRTMPLPARRASFVIRLPRFTLRRRLSSRANACGTLRSLAGGFPQALAESLPTHGEPWVPVGECLRTLQRRLRGSATASCTCVFGGGHLFLGARKGLPCFSVMEKEREFSRSPCIVFSVLSTPSNATQGATWLPARPSRRPRVENSVIRYFLYVPNVVFGRRPCSLRSPWGKFTRFWYMAERARRGRETALFSPVAALRAARGHCGGLPLAGHGAELSRPLCAFCGAGRAFLRFRENRSLRTLTLPLDLDL